MNLFEVGDLILFGEWCELFFFCFFLWDRKFRKFGFLVELGGFVFVDWLLDLIGDW